MDGKGGIFDDKQPRAMPVSTWTMAGWSSAGKAVSPVDRVGGAVATNSCVWAQIRIHAAKPRRITNALRATGRSRGIQHLAAQCFVMRHHGIGLRGPRGPAQFFFTDGRFF